MTPLQFIPLDTYNCRWQMEGFQALFNLSEYE